MEEIDISEIEQAIEQFILKKKNVVVKVNILRDVTQTNNQMHYIMEITKAVTAYNYIKSLEWEEESRRQET